MRVLFLGTPEFAVPSLEALLGGPDTVVGVVSQPDRPKGRGLRNEPTPVARAAGSAGVPVFQPERLHSAQFLDTLRVLDIDLAVTAAFGRLLRPALLGLPRHGCLNVHASLLPRHRGAAPIARAILDGDPMTGITVFRLDEGMDTGPMIAQRFEPILADDTQGTLAARLARLGGAVLMEACEAIRSGRAQFTPQVEDGATYAPILRKEDGRCDFSRPADQIDRFVRAFHPWPGAVARIRGVPLRLHRVAPIDRIDSGAPPGTVVGFDPRPVIAARPGRVALVRVQAEGKREMDADAWARGFRLESGERLE